MKYFIGVILALSALGLATAIGLARSRAFYPTVFIVIGSYYVLFAVMGTSTRALWTEIAFAAFVSLIAATGFRRNLWLVATTMIGHDIFDFFHHSMVLNPGVPVLVDGVCLAFDAVAGLCMAFSLLRRGGSR